MNTKHLCLGVFSQHYLCGAVAFGMGEHVSVVEIPHCKSQLAAEAYAVLFILHHFVDIDSVTEEKIHISVRRVETCLNFSQIQQNCLVVCKRIHPWNEIQSFIAKHMDLLSKIKVEYDPDNILIDKYVEYATVCLDSLVNQIRQEHG